jgi:hypothetical protein
LELFNMSLRSGCLINEAVFRWKCKNFHSLITLLKCWIIRISVLSDVTIKEFCCMSLCTKLKFLQPGWQMSWVHTYTQPECIKAVCYEIT